MLIYFLHTCIYISNFSYKWAEVLLIFVYNGGNLKYENLETFYINFIGNNKLHLFLFDELSLINLVNLKNLLINYNPSVYTSYYDLYSNPALTLYDIKQHDKNYTELSLCADYVRQAAGIFSSVFNFPEQFTFESAFSNHYIKSFLQENSSYKFLSVSFYKNQIFCYASWFTFMLSVIMVISFIIWVFSLVSYVVNTFFKNEKTYDNYNVVANYLVESEKELGSLDDMFVGISILICIYGWFFFSTFFFNFFSNISLSHLYVGFPLFLFIVLGMPTNMLWNYGILYPVFLRGSSNTTILSLEFMYDILATGIMYIRLIVQNVRFLLMFFAFFECYEFFLNTMFITRSYYFYTPTDFSINSFFMFFSSLVNFIIFYVYNIGHLLYTIISHFFAYLVLVFWFFSFLYTTFFEEKIEVYFKSKRK